MSKTKIIVYLLEFYGSYLSGDSIENIIDKTKKTMNEFDLIDIDLRVSSQQCERKRLSSYFPK
jgi:hypothetical protein